MAAVKIYTNDELKKMSEKDRMDVLKKVTAELAHDKLHVRAKEDKQSHKIRAKKKLIARIHTLNKQPQQ